MRKSFAILPLTKIFLWIRQDDSEYMKKFFSDLMLVDKCIVPIEEMKAFGYTNDTQNIIGLYNGKFAMCFVPDYGYQDLEKSFGGGPEGADIGAVDLNDSRGPLVVEQDLADALNSGKVYAAAVDVVGTEPIQSGNPLLTAKNCIITPHIARAPRESRQRLMDVAIGNLEAFLNGSPISVVNP